MPRIILRDGKIPTCPECGDELPTTDVGVEDENGDTWADLGPCENPECRRKIYMERLNPKYYHRGCKA